MPAYDDNLEASNVFYLGRSYGRLTNALGSNEIKKCVDSKDQQALNSGTFLFLDQTIYLSVYHFVMLPPLFIFLTIE